MAASCGTGLRRFASVRLAVDVQPALAVAAEARALRHRVGRAALDEVRDEGHRAGRVGRAARLARDHLPWAIESLRLLAAHGEFYSHVALATADCIVALLAATDTDAA